MPLRLLRTQKCDAYGSCKTVYQRAPTTLPPCLTCPPETTAQLQRILAALKSLRRGHSDDLQRALALRNEAARVLQAHQRTRATNEDGKIDVQEFFSSIWAQITTIVQNLITSVGNIIANGVNQSAATSTAAAQASNSS